jgi:hypothetical protein
MQGEKAAGGPGRPFIRRWRETVPPGSESNSIEIREQLWIKAHQELPVTLRTIPVSTIMQGWGGLTSSCLLTSSPDSLPFIYSTPAIVASFLSSHAPSSFLSQDLSMPPFCSFTLIQSVGPSGETDPQWALLSSVPSLCGLLPHGI